MSHGGEAYDRTEGLYEALPGPYDTVLLPPAERPVVGPELLLEPEDRSPIDRTGVFKALRRIETLPRIRPARRRPQSDLRTAPRKRSSHKRPASSVLGRFLRGLMGWVAG
ncbi:MAG: hypothetical protein M5U26_22065 [Planctomycetota bacterium]|nr:hypothetical protein [Planctomycetota bacterium]